MSDFEKWFVAQDFYTNMRFIHGDALFHKDSDVYRILPVQMTYLAWSEQRQRSKDEFVSITQEWHTKGWNNRQEEVDDLRQQLNNMEACYIEKKKERDDLNEKEILQDHFYDQAAELKNSKLMINELQKRVDVVGESIESFFDNQVGTPTQREYCNFIAEIKQALRGES